ncbi:flagellar hook-length control protein FliK [Halobacillus yeomjeoni]|uniref:Flagellar hook-length control protein FliK n=1 Tax=Halobacillus yeomjeoni TaxID=311194 RepID=A0A931MU92_9BACI|nr:flagellar hook-length control protein FliK [Halobacillus yeomjeoni]MBH0229275.1 flagellar hook-length control protein FliK [Halobacillus yeomjeoni]
MQTVTSNIFKALQMGGPGKGTPKAKGAAETFQQMLGHLQKGDADVPKNDSEMAASITALFQGAVTHKVSDSKNVNVEGLLEAALGSMNVQAGENLAQMEKQLKDLWQEFQKLIQPLTSMESITPTQIDSKTSLAIKNVLEQFTKLMDQFPLENKKQLEALMAKVTKEGAEKEQKVFQNLLNSFRNRQKAPASYHQQHPVSGKDIAKWVSKSMVQNSPVETTTSVHTFSQSMPMTKVEQYVIHINHNQSPDSAQKQLIQEFERILQSSRFQVNQAGNRELLLRLRPANLGDMTVKFAVVNGEMAVKILVSTQAAKEMMEGNMTQLRHMFSPQQVIIEKNEGVLTQQSFHQESEFEEESDQGSREGSERERQQKDDEDEPEQSFHEILMNEKV